MIVSVSPHFSSVLSFQCCGIFGGGFGRSSGMTSGGLGDLGFGFRPRHDRVRIIPDFRVAWSLQCPVTFRSNPTFYATEFFRPSLLNITVAMVEVC